MENENLKPIEKLTPFTKMIMTIGTLPSSFYSSMSYYESMVWLYEYLKNQVIPALNNNGEAVEELQEKYIELKDYVTGKVDELETYMNNYFDNLDVQEEINNKLDEMARTGTLTTLIKDYVDPIYESYENVINGRLDNQDDEISLFKSSINTKINAQDSLIESIESGSPLVASSTSEMLDTTRVYVNTTDGNWYYYDGDSWEIGGAYQSSVDPSALNKAELELKAIEGYKIFDDLAYGNVTTSKTPILTDHTDFMYQLIDINELNGEKKLYSYFKSTIYNILVKRSIFDENNVLKYVDGDWIKVNNGLLIDLDTLNYDTQYLGFTFIYSTDLTATNRINNIPLDELFITDCDIPNKENFEFNKQNLLNITKNYAGYNIYNIFEYGGYVARAYIHDTNRSYKYIKINANDFTRDLFLKTENMNPTNYAFVYLALFNNGVEVFNSSNFQLKTNNDRVANITWKDSYTFDTMLITIRYCTSNTYNPSNIVENIPLNDIYITPYINSINNRLINLESSIGLSNYDAIVDTQGTYGYTSINQAILDTNDGDKILILSGTYNEDVQMWGKNRELIGENRDTCIIYSSNGLYNTPALEVNIGKIKNLTIISGNDTISEDTQYAKAYGIHIEYPNASPYTVDIENCHVISYLHSGIGIGCRFNQTINIKNCIIETKASHTWSEGLQTYIDCGAILFHNDSMNTSFESDGKLNVINCELIGKSKAVMIRSMENGNTMTAKFIGNIAYTNNQNLSNVVGFWGGGSKGTSPYMTGTDIILDNLSYNNRSNELDYLTYWS